MKQKIIQQKRNAVLIYATEHMNCENVIKPHHPHIQKHPSILHYSNYSKWPEKVKIQRKRQFTGLHIQEKGEGETTTRGYMIFIENDENIL